MPRNIRWDESVKENALNLVEALLKQADDELDDLELKAAVYVEWVTQNKLRVTGKEKQKRGKKEQDVEVGTRKEHLVKLVKKAGKSLKLPLRKKESGSSQPERELAEVQTALDCLRELGVFEEEKNTRKNQGYWKFTLTLKHQTATREENLEVVQQKWKEHPKTNSLITSPTTPILETEKSIDWQNICRNRLEKQKQLTTNRLMSAQQMLFDINQICVDLALVERKQPDKRSGDDNPEQSQLYKPDYEETQKLEYEEFLATVLKASPSNKIAIIGEPGAGKTTLLQRIAFWILDNTDGLPIWIPLGNLPTPAKLKDYLLNNWLEDAILSVTPKIRAEFEGLLTTGRVWLLLDGVDEMVANWGNPLSFIDNWIPGWCQQLSVVLTCRLNVWEANPHALNNFQTYRTLEFSQEKVNEFIEACFQESNPALGTQLQQALNQPGKERIKDLMRNPLRLTLLCSIWHLRDGKLPDTKAELYQQFVEEVYRWKKDEFRTEPEEREQLNANLKELALAAIDKEENRFCLRHKFVEGILGDRDGSVFQLALNIGWLNRVGLDAKNPNPNQPVYAFFHPTFQEYFAALAIEDWDFFLPRAHDNHNPKPVSERYRIFEPQWKEVILLWLGRPNEEVDKDQKEEFIKKLVNFKDGCTELFYRYQAYLLAAAGIAEFNDFSDSNTRNYIVDKIVKWSFGQIYKVEFPYPQTQESKSNKVVENAARAILSETDRKLVITKLSNLLDEEGRSEKNIFEVASFLLRFSPDHFKSLETMKHLIKESQNPEIAKWASLKFLESTPDESDPIFNRAYKILLEPIGGAITREAWESNWEYWTKWYSNKPNCGIEALIRLLSIAREAYNNQNQSEKMIVSNIPLRGITIQDQVQELIEILETGRNPESHLMYIHHLSYIGHGNQDAIQKLIEIVKNPKIKDFYYAAIQGLGLIGIGSREAFDCLLEVINHGIVPPIDIWSMKNILDGDLFDLAVRQLKHQFLLCYEVIWHCAQNMTYPAFYQAWHQQEGVEKTTTPDSQSLNQSDLPQSLQSAIANDPQLSQIIHLICIDGSNFIDPNNPAAKIYAEMVKRGCPKCDDGIPKTLAELQIYWDLLEIESDKRLVLVFYASSTDTTPNEGTTLSCPYSEAFLRVLSKFGREICVITEQRFDHIRLQFFAPSQAIADVVEWIRAS